MLAVVEYISNESEEQIKLFEWADRQYRNNMVKYEYLGLMFHIPNGGKRNITTAVRLKREGVKRGVPDIFIPVPKGKYFGLFIEMKSKNGKLTDEQKFWIEMLNELGYKAIVCKGFEEARDAVLEYGNLS